YLGSDRRPALGLRIDWPPQPRTHERHRASACAASVPHGCRSSAGAILYHLPYSSKAKEHNYPPPACSTQNSCVGAGSPVAPCRGANGVCGASTPVRVDTERRWSRRTRHPWKPLTCCTHNEYQGTKRSLTMYWGGHSVGLDICGLIEGR